MSKITKWSFESNNAGRWKGFNDSDIERFKKGRYLSLAREVIQNSNDAVLDRIKPVRVEFDLLKINTSSIPDVEGLKDKLANCVPHAKADHNPEAGKWFTEAVKIINASNVSVLRMSDFNTTGMEGPCELGTPFFAYMKAMGTSQKNSETSGGSHGIGKRAPLACSQLRTLFVISKYRDKKNEVNMLAQGFSALMSHSKSKHSKTGPFVDGEGFWGYPNCAQPVDDPLLLPNWLTREEIGTSIYLLAFEEAGKWKERLIAITMSNYFAAIYRGKLEVKIGDVEISKETIAELFGNHSAFRASLEDEEELARFDSAKCFFETLDDSHPELKIEVSQLQILGRTAVRLIVREGLPSEYAVIRGGMMITTSLPQLKQFPNYKDFVAVVECLDPEGERLLRSMEPSRHDDFEPDQFESEKDKKKARTALKQLQSHIRNSIKKFARDNAGEAGSIDFLSMYLADEAEQGADTNECDVDPSGKILITPKQLKPSKKSTLANGGDTGGGGLGMLVGGGGKPATGGGNDGNGDGVLGGVMTSGEVRVSSVRLIKNGGNFTILLTPEDTRKVRLSVFAVGQDFEERIPITSTSLGTLEGGDIVIAMNKGGRIKLDAILSRESLGSYKLYAKEIL